MKKYNTISLGSGLSALLAISGCGMSTIPSRTPVAATSAFRKSVLHDPRVAFVGDGLTWHWIVDVQAEHPTWINAGTPGGAPWETSGEMLARFPEVLAQHPDVVNIIVGAGDMIATDPTTGYGVWTGPCGPTQQVGEPALTATQIAVATCANVEDMIAMGEKAGAYVIVGSVPYPESQEDGPGANVGEFNDILLTVEGVPPADGLVDYAGAVQESTWTSSQPGTITSNGDPVIANALGESILTQAAVGAIEQCRCGGEK